MRLGVELSDLVIRCMRMRVAIGGFWEFGGNVGSKRTTYSRMLTIEMRHQTSIDNAVSECLVARIEFVPKTNTTTNQRTNFELPNPKIAKAIANRSDLVQRVDTGRATSKVS